MLVINLFGGAGAGKSTTRAGLFHLMKLQKMNCEESIEWVKQKVYEENHYIFTDQLYILAKQAKNLKQLEGKVDYVVTDSPLLLSIVYGKNITPAFCQVVLEEFNRYKNLNIFINRVKPYSKIGRLQTEDEAKNIDQFVLHTLTDLGIPYYIVDGDELAPSKILEIVRGVN